ncbi:hypothetical protein [Hyalangium minutum]|uniref:Uncharacterized protein n=1 Tax=Hyalangium minutum TaxID=394096 RepID=A0A085VXE0_9BACT|nr:hypothetical protein [Hyalangium minutum]KFE60103.1 hypothetical protein DB31_5974 [Hyalangium minutum]
MNKPPPLELLPPGAQAWALLNDVAIRTGKEVRTVRNACEQGLFHSIGLAGGYLGIWVAVREGGWPVDGPKVQEYRAHRSARAKVGQPKATAAATRARAKAKDTKKKRA